MQFIIKAQRGSFEYVWTFRGWLRKELCKKNDAITYDAVKTRDFIARTQRDGEYQNCWAAEA